MFGDFIKQLPISQDQMTGLLTILNENYISILYVQYLFLLSTLNSRDPANVLGFVASSSVHWASLQAQFLYYKQ